MERNEYGRLECLQDDALQFLFLCTRLTGGRTPEHLDVRTLVLLKARLDAHGARHARQDCRSACNKYRLDRMNKAKSIICNKDTAGQSRRPIDAHELPDLAPRGPQADRRHPVGSG